MIDIRSNEDAEKWLAILHRRTVRDAERMNIIEARLSLAETSWWCWRKRRDRRAWLSFLRRQAVLR